MSELEDKKKDFNYRQQEVINDIKWLEKLLLLGITLAGVIVVTKWITTGDDFDFKGVKLPLSKAWVIFLLLTIAHGYLTYLFAAALSKMWADPQSTDSENQRVFEELTVNGSLMLRGLVPRIERAKGILGAGYRMDRKDPTSWLAHAGALAMVIAIVPFHPGGAVRLLAYLVFAAVLLVLNWLLASHWLIAISHFSVKRTQDHYLNDYDQSLRVIFFPEPNRAPVGSVDPDLLAGLLLPVIWPFLLIRWITHSRKGIRFVCLCLLIVSAVAGSIMVFRWYFGREIPIG